MKSSIYQIFSLWVNKISYKEALKIHIERATENTSSFTCFANTHMVVEAYLKSTFAEKLEKSDMILPDGWPVSKAMKIFYGIKQERIAGMDFLFDFLKLSDEKGLRVLIFGSTEEVVSLAKNRIKSDYPKVNWAGHICPPFNEKWDNSDYINQINSSKTNFVLVSLGCPKQEIWMSEHYSEINSTLLGIGAALTVFAGIMPRCPKWLRDNGMEWAFRLLQEPRRLFKRYFISNFIFVFLFLREFILIKLRIKSPSQSKEI